MQLHVSCCYYLLVTAISEALECLPIAVGFNRFLNGVRQVGKEVKACPRFYVIDAYGVVGIG